MAGKLPDCPKIDKKFLPSILEDQTYKELTPQGKYLYQNLLTLAMAGWLMDENHRAIPLENIQNFVDMDDLSLKLAIIELGAEKLLQSVDGLLFLPRYFEHVQEAESEINHG